MICKPCAAPTHLDDLHFRLESRRQLVQHLPDKTRVVQHLAHLHNPHDRRLDQDLSVLLDVLVGGLLFHLQFGLEREVDVDSELFAENKR